ncbi:YqzH family protein [Bacillus sp. Marseille-Q3570]|uniref:YqzH family protein n=1 Tax=Bacillus sp. Marseille-Q3570 TaxID=2963522 RepID=UPI0021B74F90|nr:YqzH family protein [Bacillus sp. Marseille-Q3570]
MEKKLLRKMIDRCVVDYFGDLELSPLTEDEYDELIEQVTIDLHTQQAEEVFAIVHDKVYSYLSSGQ